jgi:hypothetical protein
MTSPSEADLKEQRLKYFGAVSASLSHEINNVLAIVGELSGLVEDLAEGAGGGGLDPARLKSIGEKIARHVERGKGYVGTLNRFAHSVDESWSSFDSGASVLAVVAVCDRLARLRRAELRLDSSGEWPQLEGSLCDFEHLVFRAIGAALLTVDRGGTVTLGLVDNGGSSRLEISASGSVPVAAEDEELGARLELVEALAEQQGVGVERREADGHNLTLWLTLPRILEAESFERSR